MACSSSQTNYKELEAKTGTPKQSKHKQANSASLLMKKPRIIEFKGRVIERNSIDPDLPQLFSLEVTSSNAKASEKSRNTFQRSRMAETASIFQNKS